MKANSDDFSIIAMCRILGVSKSGYYDWQGALDKPDNGNRQSQMDELVGACFHNFKGRYGAPRITVALKQQGHHYDRKTVASSMARQELCAKAGRKFKARTTDSNHDLPVYENLLNQNFRASKPNEKWVGDITYLATSEGWLYLAVIIDLYSRKVVGWSMSRRMKKALVCNAFRSAMRSRGNPKGLIMHTDRGSQYCSNQYRKLLEKTSTVGSMSAKGCCYDNAPAESFFHSLKVELLHGEDLTTRDQTRAAVFHYIEAYYNTIRSHSTLNYLSPAQFEAGQGKGSVWTNWESEPCGQAMHNRHQAVSQNCRIGEIAGCTQLDHTLPQFDHTTPGEQRDNP